MSRYEFMDRLNRGEDMSSVVKTLDVSNGPENTTHLKITKDILEVLTGLSKLKSLILLDISLCSWLKKISDDLSEYNSLEQINISTCKQIKTMPKLSKNIKKLFFLGCDNLENIYDDASECPNLEDLSLRGCYKIENLPNNLSKNLKKLTVLKSPKIKIIPDCPNLEQLNVAGSVEYDEQYVKIVTCAIENLPEVAENIKILKLADCPKLKFIPYYPKLEYFAIDGCAIETLPNEEFKNLKKLSLVSCPKIKSIPHCPNLEYLEL